jgi:hypothetical protein
VDLEELSWEIQLDDIKIEKEIGSGNYGVCFSHIQRWNLNRRCYLSFATLSYRL